MAMIFVVLLPLAMSVSYLCACLMAPVPEGC